MWRCVGYNIKKIGIPVTLPHILFENINEVRIAYPWGTISIEVRCGVRGICRNI